MHTHSHTTTTLQTKKTSILHFSHHHSWRMHRTGPPRRERVAHTRLPLAWPTDLRAPLHLAHTCIGIPANLLFYPLSLPCPAFVLSSFPAPSAMPIAVLIPKPFLSHGPKRPITFPRKQLCKGVSVSSISRPGFNMQVNALRARQFGSSYHW